MSQHDEFLAEVLANPDDMSPRLVYADWLEERGDPRAELIRVQCRLDELTDEDRDTRKFEQRNQELLRDLKDGLVAEIAPLVFSARVMRGFIEEIALGPKQFLDHRQRLFELGPIRHVNLLRLGPNWAEPLRDCAEWRHVRSLNLWSNTLSTKGLTTLLGSPHFTRLEELTLGYYDSTFIYETDAPKPLCALKELTLSGNSLRTHWAFARWWVGRLPHLERLHLSQCKLSGDGMAEMLSHSFPRLKVLDLAHSPLKDEGAAALAQCARFDRLESLDLRDTELGSAGVQALAASPHLQNLRRINLSQSRLSPAAVEALVEAFQPTTLRLNECHLTDDAVSILATASTLSGLRVLELEGNPRRKGLTNAAALSLLKSPYLKQLTTLNLRHATIDAETQRTLRAHFGVGVCTFSEARKR